MSNEDKIELNRAINKLWKNFVQVRSTYPYGRPEFIGRNTLPVRPYYRSQGLGSQILFPNKITKKDISLLNELGYWINQSAIIRLCALLEAYKVITKTSRINANLEGHEEVDIQRRLRNYFVHTKKYDSSDPDQLKLYNRVVSHFNLTDEESSKFNLPIPINTVVEKIFTKVKLYISQIEIQ
jgi:hypothetical protein